MPRHQYNSVAKIVKLYHEKLSHIQYTFDNNLTISPPISRVGILFKPSFGVLSTLERFDQIVSAVPPAGATVGMTRQVDWPLHRETRRVGFTYLALYTIHM
jgi:hypothetical protein